MNVRDKLPRRVLLLALSVLTLSSTFATHVLAVEARGCAQTTLDWVARADAELAAHVEAVECFPGHSHVRLDRGDSPPLDVDVAVPPGKSFRKIGQVGASPMIEVPDFGAVPAPQREAFDLFCAWIEKHEMEVARSSVIPIPVLRSIPLVEASWFFGPFWSRSMWVVVCGLVIVVALHATRRLRTTEAGHRDVSIFAGLFLGGFLLRVLFGPFGPHHVNGQGPSWIIAAYLDPTLLTGYGPGYYEIFSLLCQLFPTHQDATVFVANLVFGALAPALLFVLARQCTLDSRRAAWAGAILAVDAVSIRFAATEAYFTPIITLSLGSAILYMWSFACLQRKEARLEGIGFALLGALITVQAARIHPVAWGPLALGPSYVLSSRVQPSKLKPWAWRLGATCAIAFLVLVLVGMTSGPILSSSMGNVNRYWTAHSFFDTLARAAIEWVPSLCIAGIILVFLVKPPWLLIPAVASCVALFATRNIYAQSPIWISTYDRLWLSAPILVLVSTVPHALVRSWRTGTAIAIATLLFFVSGWSTLRDRTTEQLEYSFFRDAFSSWPSGCRVIHVGRVEKRIVALPEYAIPSSTPTLRSVLSVTSPSEVKPLLQPGTCLRYAHTSLCTSPEGRPLCAAVENEMHLVPLAEKDFPAKPSHVTSTYDRDIVHVGLFNVQLPDP